VRYDRMWYTLEKMAAARDIKVYMYRILAKNTPQHFIKAFDIPFDVLYVEWPKIDRARFNVPPNTL